MAARLPDKDIKEVARLLKKHGSIIAAAHAAKLSYTTFCMRMRIARDRGIPLPEYTQAKRQKSLTDTELREAVEALREHGSQPKAALALGMSRPGFQNRINEAEARGLLRDPEQEPFAAPKHMPTASIYGDKVPVELLSNKDNTFLFGAAGDLHAASKYTRWDVREDLYRQFIEAGAQCNFDTGNWIDGEANFNKFDIEVHGFDAQCKFLAQKHPKGLRTYAIWGDDHEGWYVQREGIDVGAYAAHIMTGAGHDWHDLGFMEAHVLLRNANSGETATLAVVHPGGGSAYALSYSIQKIVESLEGGEKPDVGLYGHFHKLMSANIRNVWTVQTGCQQDQTPFLRKRRIAAHVGGTLIKLRQDPRTGAIVSMTVELIRYFNRDYYGGTCRWSKHGPVHMLKRGQL